MDALRKMVSTPRRESAEFMAAMSYLVHLAPEEAAPHLEERVRLLDEEIDRVEAGMRAASAWVLRINLIESEYLLAMLRAERDWARSLAADVREGRLAWNLDRIYAEIKANTEAAGLVEE